MSLESFAGRKLGGYRISLKVEEGKNVDGFEVRLTDPKGRASKPVVEGRYFKGTKWIRPWMEIEYSREVEFDGDTIDLTWEGLEEEFFKIISEPIPPGGHIMVKYLEHKETAMALSAGVPPPATPLGYLMWRSGFRWFKDWYFPEGWMEGDQKLQGNRPLNEEHRRKREREAEEELNEFLGKEHDLTSGIEKTAVELAKKVLGEIEFR